MKPTAKVTGYYGGYATIAPFDNIVFEQGQVLYSYEEVLKAIEEERKACAKEASDLAEIGYDGFAVAIALRATARARGEVK